MKRTLLLAAAAFVVAVPALAEGWGHHMGGHHMGGHHMGGGMMQRMDLNGDGKVSAAEAEAVRSVMFLSWDADGDGILTQDEMVEKIMARVRHRIAKRFEMHDVNGDGRIDPAEFAESSTARFAEMDVDGDGSLSGDELKAMHHRGQGRGEGRKAKPGN